MPCCCTQPDVRLVDTFTDPPDWIRVEEPGAIPYRLYTKRIIKSEQDERDYRIIELDNGLRATLVHDGKADKSAASMDVGIGYLHDPDDIPGLAHFCEHLLFMGTKQFPEENEYSEFLAKNNGSTNAYTSSSNTNYHFSVASSALAGALERFSGFFHSPLFSPSSTLRELNAVDSENKKNHQSDLWRISQVRKHLSRPGHVYSKFGTGSRESITKAAKELQSKGQITENASCIASDSSELDADGGPIGRETRRRVVEWWKKEYCASRMNLCIVGQDSLDDLTELATTLFSHVPNRGRDARPMFNEHPFGPDEKCTLVSVQTIKVKHIVEIWFPLEYQPPLWKHKPIRFISHFVGHEGPGSLLSYLKKKQWATALRSGSGSLARGIATFRISIDLTPEGFINYRSVILATYKYFALLRSAEFSRFHYKELVTLSATSFRFAEKEQPHWYAEYISEHMDWPLPPEFLLAGAVQFWDWDDAADQQAGEAKIAEYLQQFRIHESRVVLMAKKDEHLKVNPNITWDTEPWYGTEYSVQPFDETFIREAEDDNDISDLFLPGVNVFIPANLEVEKPIQRPRLIRETPLSSLWYKRDDKFWVPKTYVSIDLRSNHNISARAAVITRLYANIVTDSLTEFAYDADLAGLSYELEPYYNGLSIDMKGYNDKIFVLAQHILDKVKGLVVDPQRLSVMKEQVRIEWENFSIGDPYSISAFYGRYLLSERNWTIEEKLLELPSVTLEDIQNHMKELFAQVNMRIFVMGNMFKDEAIRIAEMAEENLGPSPVSPTDLNSRALILPSGSNFVWSAPLSNPNEANSALTYYLHFGSIADQKLRVVSALLVQILKEPSFNVLRTKEQLGYIVHCSSHLLPGASEICLRILIQSEKKPGYLEERVEAFLREMKTKLEEMTDEEFRSQMTGLEKKWLEADKNLFEEASRLVDHITSGHLDFLRREKDASFLKSITKDDALSLFMTHVHPDSTTRSKLSVHMVSQKIRPTKVSIAASQAFETVVHEAFPDVDEKAWKQCVETTEPSLDDFSQYWLKVLDSDDGLKLVAQIPDLVDKYPVDGEGEDRKRSDVIYIEDANAFKSGLAVSVDPGPFVQWDDLPVPQV